uniref:Uncharacterized protein n=1 Tax=Hemiselmis tepida TaxID=464990 RepID=A0A7S0VEE4_9CRYP|mmetsp:Transcript_17178/g.43279  ORF Transcript_17178/g.43279 Transcript_17178/m.43279 type:complete len:111 (+) Transcript_17178:2158-2490(+)
MWSVFTRKKNTSMERKLVMTDVFELSGIKPEREHLKRFVLQKDYVTQVSCYCFSVLLYIGLLIHVGIRYQERVGINGRVQCKITILSFVLGDTVWTRTALGRSCCWAAFR